MIILYIYLIGFFLTPILTVALDKTLPGSMGLGSSDDDIVMSIFMSALLWVLMIFVIIFALLKYWHKH
jgi:hypothetical protein